MENESDLKVNMKRRDEVRDKKLVDNYKKLNFCTAGSPISTKPSGTLNGLKRLKELGLDGLELEFVRGIRMKPELAKRINVKREELGLELTAHAPYYINLNSHDESKRITSMKHIINTARIAYLAGAKSITFHAGYYLKDDKEIVFERIRDGLKQIVSELNDENIHIWIRPELTGKTTQFGCLRELIRISQEVEMVMPCIDFAHYYARSLGKYNSYEDFARIFEEIEKGLGKKALSNMHMHFSGIEFGNGGEKRHLTLGNSEFNYKALAKALKDYEIKGVLISESPVIELDALLMKQVYSQM